MDIATPFQQLEPNILDLHPSKVKNKVHTQKSVSLTCYILILIILPA